MSAWVWNLAKSGDSVVPRGGKNCDVTSVWAGAPTGNGDRIRHAVTVDTSMLNFRNLGMPGLKTKKKPPNQSKHRHRVTCQYYQVV